MLARIARNLLSGVGGRPPGNLPNIDARLRHDRQIDVMPAPQDFGTRSVEVRQRVQTVFSFMLPSIPFGSSYLQIPEKIAGVYTSKNSTKNLNSR